MAEEPDDPMLEDDGTRAVIREAVAKQMDALPEDEDVFDGPGTPAETRETVGLEEGAEMVGAAKQPPRRKVEASKAEPVVLEEPKPEPAAPPATDDAALLDGLPDDRREAIARRLGEAGEVLGLFKGREETMKALGVTPKDAMRSLLDIHAYANEKPADYLAWAAAQISPQAPDALLSEAADRLGFKLVPKDDDPFEDEAVRALREENRRLKGAQSIAGPNDPARRAQAELAAFRAEANPDGTPKRPLFDRLGPQIAERARAHVAQTGRPVTTADLGRLYDEVVAELRVGVGAPMPSPAAQAAPAVSGQSPNKAAVDRAKAASKSIDGAGQGASRQPALDDNASLRDVIRAQLRSIAD